MSNSAKTKYGAILPMITADGRIGSTASCSMVPVSFSRTSPIEVMMVPIRAITSPAMAGTSTHDVDRSGLNSTSARSSPPLLPVATCTDCATNSADPST